MVARLAREKMRIGIILVVFNEKHHLERLFLSLKRQSFQDFKIYFVDNNSSDGSVEYSIGLNNKFKFDIEYIILKENMGFAKGNNIGCAKAINDGVDYIFVVNPDMELDNNCLEVFIKYLSSQNDIGVISSVILNGNAEKHKEIIQQFGTKVNFKTQNKYNYYTNRLLRDTQLPDYFLVDYVCGGATFLKKEVYNKIGLFEEKYFIYNDEIDFGFRAKNANIKIVVTSKTKIWHHHDWSKKNISGYKFMYYLMMRNRVLYFKKFKLYLYLIYDLFLQVITFPLKVKMFYRIGSLSILKYYYLGLLRGLFGETGKSSIQFK